MGAAKNIEMEDEDEICACESVDRFKVLYFSVQTPDISKDAQNENCLAVKHCKLGTTVVSDQLKMVDVLAYEFRIVEFFEDLEAIKLLLQKRPLLPIIGINKNQDLELKVMAFKAGVVEVLPGDVTATELSARLNAVGKFGRACRLMELQNDELIRSMNDINALEIERQKSQATLVQNSKMASLGEMAGNLAHEINNPLGILNGRILHMRKILAQTPPTLSEASEVLDRMSAVSKRIAAITKGLKSFSRMGEKDPMEATSVSSIVDDTLSFCAEGIRQLGIELTVEAVDNSFMIDCRPTQISQVILNLLSNARDAVEAYSEKWIKLSVDVQPDASGTKFVMVRITDSGKGLPPELVKKIYKPFFTTKPVNKGTGLGLSISKTILHEHGGELTLDTASPNTCFVVKIPLKV